MKASVSLPPSTVFLSFILNELDADIAQLRVIRDAFAEVQANRASFSEKAPELLETVTVELPAPDEDTTVAEPKRRGRPRGSLNRRPYQRITRHVPEPRALATNIPAGPVVVSAADLARRRAAVVAAAPAPVAVSPAEGTLEALIREVKGRQFAA